MTISKGIGIDLVEVARFSALTKKNKAHLLAKLFTKAEIRYCMSHKDPAPHLAGMFAAKEAVSKALGTAKHPFVEIEIRHARNGAPEAWHKGKKLNVRVSVTHAGAYAAAVAMV